MNETLLPNQHVLLLLFADGTTALSAIVAAGIALFVLKGWDLDRYDAMQYRRQKYAWLVATLLIFSIALAIFALAYFVFTLDTLSSIVPGAMCAAGVISYTANGIYLLYLKIITLGLAGWWILLYREEIYRGDWHHLKKRMYLAILLSLLWTVTWIMQWHFFAAIDTHRVLRCCTTLYGLFEGVNPLPWGLDPLRLAILFFLLYGTIIAAWIGRERRILLVALLLFLIVSYYAVLYIFGPYIYEQPNHNCPFCMMKRDYYYVGYILWGALTGGSFAGIWAMVSELCLKHPQPALRRTMALLLTLFLLICIGYFLHYYLRYHTLLKAPVDSMSKMMGMP